MGVSTTTNRMAYIGDGTTTTFSFPYYFFAQADLNVWLWDTVANTATLQTLNSTYTITGTTNSSGLYVNGGSVVMSAAPSSTKILVVIRNPTEVQNYSLSQNQTISSSAIVQEMDYLTLLIQRLEDQTSRCVSIPDGVGSAFSALLPPSVASSASAGMAIVVNPSGTGFALATVAGAGGITALTGPITASGSGSVATTVTPNSIDNTMAAQMAAHTFKGNNTASTANAKDLTATELTAELNPFSSTLKGLVPASGGGTTNFMRADGSWATPSSVNPMTTLGDSTYGGAAGALTRLAGDTSNTRKFMRTQSSGGVATAPAWDTIIAADVPTLNQNTTGSAATATSATSATTATNIAGGLGGSIPYQTAVGATALLANGSSGQVLTSQGTTLAPTWSSALTNPMTTAADMIIGGASGAATRLANGLIGQVLRSFGGTNAPAWSGMLAPNIQKFTSGSSTYGLSYYFFVTAANATAGATYTNNTQTFTVVNTITSGTQLLCTSTGAPASSGTLTKATGTGDATITFAAFTPPLTIQVIMVGGGGGSAGGGTTAGTDGGVGGTSSFGSNTCTGGGGGRTGNNSNAPGTATLATGFIGIAATGSYGNGAGSVASGSGTVGSIGGGGGTSPFGGAGGAGTLANNGIAAAANSGSGAGGGGGGQQAAVEFSGGGGSSGGYINAQISNNSPNWATTYSVVVGAGGTAGGAGGGTSPSLGAVGGSAIVIVKEKFQ